MMYLVPLWSCIDCRDYKRIDEFNKSNTLKHRPVQHKCKICEKSYRIQNRQKIAKRQKNYAQNNKEKVNQYTRNWTAKNKDKKLIYLEKNREKIAQQRREYYIKNKEKINKSNKLWALNNKEKVKEQKQEYQSKHKDRYLKNTQEWRKNNPERERQNRQKYTKNRRKTDPDYRLKCLLRGSLNTYIKNENGRKYASVLKLLGCDILTFKKYIERQFEPGISWDNRKSFQLDHISPCACYDFTIFKDQKLCYHYTNYRPLSPKQNHIKQSRDKRLGKIVKSLPNKNKEMLREIIVQNKLMTDNFGTTATHLNPINKITCQQIRIQDTV